VWNQITLAAELIPITVQKTWDDDQPNHRDPVPFKIYGVYQKTTGDHAAGDRVELTAYDGKDTNSAGRVKYITGNKNDKVWTKTVYVLNFKDPNDKFYQVGETINLNQMDETHSYEVGDEPYTKAKLEKYADKHGVINLGGTYSYAIEEGDMIYEDGWYGEPTYGKTLSVTNIKESWTETVTTEPAWTDLPGNQNQTGGWYYGQIHYNLAGFTLKQTGLKRQSEYSDDKKIYTNTSNQLK
jgi:hypothetical protein